MNILTARTPFEPANDASIQFHIIIRQFDGTLISHSGRFVDSIAANQHGLFLGGMGSRITVRPAIETSYLHGKARWPNSLHPMRTLEALEGWAAAACNEHSNQARAVNERAAMRLQLRTAGTDNLLVRT